MTEPYEYLNGREQCQCYHKDWPQTVLELIGSWDDIPQQEELPTGLGCDLPREPLEAGSGYK